MTADPRARLPSVTALLALDAVGELVATHGHDTVVVALRDELDRARTAVGEGAPVPSEDELADATGQALVRARRARTRDVVNATGVVLHTNLGRAPLGDAAIAAMVAAAGPSTVEYDLDRRRRSRRGAYAAELLRDLVGAEDALVVNNGAAALVLALAAVAGGRRVAVSRGELVEIGGSFRLPAIVEAAGVGLTEVGTTNRTRAEDYAAAVAADPDVVAFLRVHPSNFRVEGFTARPDGAELARVAHGAGVALVHDVGSGVLDDRLPLPPGADEPTVAGALAEGADVVVASGDKLLGGPQAGLLVGTHAAVEACRSHPLARALRVDKVRLAALEATLDAYRRDRIDELPTWHMLQVPVATLAARADALVAAVGSDRLRPVDLEAVVGGGTLPGVAVPSAGVALTGDAEELADALADADPPVVGRVDDGVLVLDLRTVPPAHDDHLRAVLRRVLA